MLHSIIVLSENYASFSEDWPAGAGINIYPSFLTDGTGHRKLQEAYRYFSENPVDYFSIAISATEVLTDQYIETVLSFLFIPTGLAISTRRVILLLGTDTGLLENTKQQLHDLTKTQGITNLEVYLPEPYHQSVVPDSLSENQPVYIFSRAEDLLAYYTQTLQTGVLYDTLLCLHESGTDLGKLCTLIQETENELKNTRPAAYELAAGFRQARNENALLQNQYSAVLNELNNYKLHLEVMRSSHQAKELQDYYTGEYEILPRWYKQFGHIIKVIMGKRSFRSLFSDNVKKYKY